MIKSQQEFAGTVERLTEFDSRLREQVRDLKEAGAKQSEIERITNPQVTFFLGMHEEAVAYACDHSIELSDAGLPPAPDLSRTDAMA